MTDPRAAELSLVQIMPACGRDGSVFGIDANGQVWAYSWPSGDYLNGSWNPLSMTVDGVRLVQVVPVSRYGGNLWGLDAKGQIWEYLWNAGDYLNGSWRKFPMTISETILVGTDKGKRYREGNSFGGHRN